MSISIAAIAEFAIAESKAGVREKRPPRSRLIVPKPDFRLAPEPR